MIPGIGIGVGFYPYGRGWTPAQLPNLAAQYDSGLLSSMVIDGSSRVSLWSDISGNSNVNVFASGGAASNTATASTKSITGSQVFTANIVSMDYTPGSDTTLFSKLSGNNGCEFLILTTGVVRLRIGDGASVTNVDSTASIPTSDYTAAVVVATWTDGVGASFTVNGVALGTSVAAAKTLTNAAATATIGTNLAGSLGRLRVGSVYDFNPALGTKLASSVVSGGDTWTINTSGDIGARISGARDLVQLTVTKQPIWSSSGVTGDGVNDYMKSGPFAFSQPETNYWTGKQLAWTSNAKLFEGYENVNRMGLIQTSGGASPQLSIFAGTVLSQNSGLALNTLGVVTSIFNNTSSVLRVNRLSALTGTTGTSDGNGLSIFARTSAGTPTDFSKSTASEILMYSAAHDTTTQNQIVAYLGAKWGISV